MKKFIVFTFLFVVAGLNTSYADSIPLKNFFKDTQFINMKISPNSEHVGFTYTDGDIGKLAVMKLDSKEIVSTFDFGENFRIWNFHWANDERLILEAGKWVGNLDKRGGARHFYGANLNGKQRKQLFKTSSSGISIISLLKDEPRYVLVTKRHANDDGDVKLHRMNVYTGKLQFIQAESPKPFTGLLADDTGNIRMGVFAEVDEDKFDKFEEYKVYYKKPGEEDWSEMSVPLTKERTRFNPVALSPDNRFAFVSSNHETATMSLYKYDLKSGTGEKVYENSVVDMGNLVRAYDNSVIAVRSMPNFPEFHFLNKEHKEAKLYAALINAFPGSNVSITSYSKGGENALVRVSSDKNPGDFYLFDTEKMGAKYLASARSWLKPDDMAEMNPIMVKARDGVELHGYLTLPKGKTKNLPLIVNPHGGPHGPRDMWGFNEEVQFLANRGYAVLQINFRGSGGYGKAFEEAGYRKWGREMQDDVTDATLWAIEKGIADKNRICIYGGSYGGYASLQGVVREPDLYKCALGYVGVYDLGEMFDSGDIPKRKSGKIFLKHVLGTDENVWNANSPAYNVNKIKADLFIAHGEGDVRVPMEQYDSLIGALKKAGKPVKTMVRDEGHGYVQEENKYDFYTEMEKFFEKNIGK